MSCGLLQSRFPAFRWFWHWPHQWYMQPFGARRLLQGMSTRQAPFHLETEARERAFISHVCLYFSSLQGAGGAQRMVIELGAAMRASGLGIEFVSLDPPNTDSFYPA